MQRRQVLASIAAGSAAAVGVTTATATDAGESNGGGYLVTYDDAGGRVLQRATTADGGVAADDFECKVDNCCDCPSEDICTTCYCLEPCRIE